MNVKESLDDNNWNLMPSKRATRTSNPIRKVSKSRKHNALYITELCI